MTAGAVRRSRPEALPRPRPTYHQAKAPSAMPVTHVQGHQERSPVWRAGTSRMTTRATAQAAVPTTTITLVGTVTGAVGAGFPSEGPGCRAAGSSGVTCTA